MSAIAYLRQHPYSTAILTVGLALLIMLALGPVASMTETPFLLFFGAVVVSAWQGGIRSGLVATGLGMLISDYFFLEPQYSLALNLPNGVRQAVFALECILISMVCGSLQTTNQRLDRNLLKLQASEESLRTAKERITDILESITDGFFTLDRQLQFAYVNSQAEQILGFSSDALLGQSLWEKFPGVKGTLFAQNVHRAVSEQVPVVFESYGIVNPEGWFEVHINPLCDGLAVYFQDVSERKQAEEALRLSENRYRTLANAVSQLMWMNDAKGNIQFFNQRWQEYTGIADLELGVGLWPNVIHPDDFQPTLEKRSRAMQASVAYEVECRLRRFDGSYRWHLARIVPLKDENGQVMQWYGTAMDIHEVKQTEAALRESEVMARARAEELETFMEAVPAAVWIAHDPQCQQITANRAAYQLVELPVGAVATATPADKVYPFPFKVEKNGQVVSPQDLPMQKAGRTGQDIEDEFDFVFENGKIRSIWGRAVPLRGDNGEVRGVIGAFLDISERKQAEIALRESEARFRKIADDSPMMIWMSAPDGAGIWFNRQWSEFTGQTLEEALGSGWLTAVHPDDARLIEVDCLQAHQRHEPVSLEYRLRRQDGEYRWVYDSAIPRFEDNGVYFGYIGSIIDITDRKQAEETLRQNAERLSLALSAAQLGDWSWDAATDIVTFSERAAEIFAIPPGPYMTWTQMQNVLHEEDRERARLQVQQAIAQGSDYDIEYRIIHPDATERWVAARGRTQYNSSRQVLGMLGVVQDITHRKRAETALSESEERFRTLADNIAQFAWMADSKGWLFWYNQRWFDYTGTTLEEMEGWGWQKVHHPDHVERVTEKFRVCVEAGQTWEDTFPLRGKDGQYRWFLSRAIPVRDETGKVLRWFGTNTDITERLQAEQERERLLEREQAARKEAETANRIKDEFLAVLSHELRSPLNPILGWSRLLRNGKLDAAKTIQALETIERNAKLQTQLIEDLLDVSRILQGKLSLDMAAVNLALTIEAALETVRLAAQAKSIHIQMQLDTNIGHVLGDAARLQQVVWNLLSNAVKFTPAGGQVNIWLERIGSQAQIQVRDNGKGIPRDFLPHVFEYFRQADSTTTRKFGGLGLGLAIVHHLVELHGGTVAVDSPGEGQGATFTVQLPLMPSHNQIPQDNPQAMPLAHLSGLRVLIVDDEPDIRVLVAFILEQAGATVSVAASASEALSLIEQSLPDVLICDIGMPNIDGYMLLRQLRTLPPEQGGQIPAIALTAYAGEYDQKQAMAAGFQQHLSKPIEPEELVRAISTLVESSQTRE
jgi:PAS domain S-box-containing protein